MTNHPHVHMIVPGGGISLDGTRWVSCKPGFFLPVRVLSRLYRRLFLEMLIAAHKADRLQFFNGHAALADFKTFAAWVSALRQIEWVTYAKRPFGGPEPVQAYLSRSTHRIAISNRRLVAWDDTGVTFKWKDYRIEGQDRYKVMTLSVAEFMWRFLMHVLPKRFHRCHYGLFSNGARAQNIARARELLSMVTPESKPAATTSDEDAVHTPRCPCCGGRMIIIETFERGSRPRTRPTMPILAIGIDSS